MDYKFTTIFPEHSDPEINKILHKIKGEFVRLQNSTKSTSSTTVYINNGQTLVKASQDRIRIPKIDIPVVTTGTTINFLNDCSPAQAFPHNSYMILSTECWNTDSSGAKIYLTCEYSDLTSTGFKATPAENGYLRFQCVLI